jgi:hypothetical protein
MMIGVAQVIGMNPTFRSFFSGTLVCAKTSVASLSGKSCESAASAVEAPTALRNVRRVRSRGKIARITADAITPSYRFSSLATSAQKRRSARSCSAWLAWRPHTHPAASRRAGSKGLSKVDMGALHSSRRHATGRLPMG